MSTHAKHGTATRYLGAFSVSDSKSVVGELNLDGPNTLLRLHSSEQLGLVAQRSHVSGVAYTGQCLTLIDCRSPGQGSRSFEDAPAQYFAEVFPNYVAVGTSHFEPAKPCVKAVHFTTSDLTTLFYDFDAFGHVTDARPIIDAVLKERREMRPVAAGEYPLVFYFTGKDLIVEVFTTIGKVSVNHLPSYTMGSTRGFSVDNRIAVSIEPHQPVAFHEVMRLMHDATTFLSVAAGRAQAIESIHVTTTEIRRDMPELLEVYPSYPWGEVEEIEHLKPHPGDIPLDPIQRPDEFKQVVTDWIRRHATWHVARGRYLGCMRRGNRYGAERLVAAANMFDILPPDAVPLAEELSREIASARDACVSVFRQLPVGIDRNSALSALGRLGQPSLPKKVAHRVSIVDRQLGTRFPDLQFVANVGVRCRNFFVHGKAEGFDFEKVEPLVPFLTDALEFIFAASDFIDAGWDATRWSTNHFGWGHSFSRFRGDYSFGLSELRAALAP